MLIHDLYDFRAPSLSVIGKGCWTLHGQPQSACKGMCTLKNKRCPGRRTAYSLMSTLHMLVSKQFSFHSITFGKADIYCFDISNHKVLVLMVAHDLNLAESVKINKQACSLSLLHFLSCDVWPSLGHRAAKHITGVEQSSAEAINCCLVRPRRSRTVGPTNLTTTPNNKTNTW